MTADLSYGIVITTGEIIGSKKRSWTDGCSVYTGPASKASPEDRVHAFKVAAQLAERKDFELQKNSILRIDYHAPGQLTRGHLVIRTAQESIELKLNALTNGYLPPTLNALVPSLVAFATDRFYDEKSGMRVGEVILKTGKYPKS